MNKKGRPWPVIGDEPRPWGNCKVCYFFACGFFKRSTIASSRIWLIDFFRSTARCFNFLISSGSNLVVKLSLVTSFLTLTKVIVNECIKYVNNFFLDNNVLMFYCVQ